MWKIDDAFPCQIPFPEHEAAVGRSTLMGGGHVRDGRIKCGGYAYRTRLRGDWLAWRGMYVMWMWSGVPSSLGIQPPRFEMERKWEPWEEAREASSTRCATYDCSCGAMRRAQTWRGEEGRGFLSHGGQWPSDCDWLCWLCWPCLRRLPIAPVGLEKQRATADTGPASRRMQMRRSCRCRCNCRRTHLQLPSRSSRNSTASHACDTTLLTRDWSSPRPRPAFHTRCRTCFFLAVMPHQQIA